MKYFLNLKRWQKAAISLIGMLTCSSILFVIGVGIFNIIPRTYVEILTSTPVPLNYNEVPKSNSSPTHKVNDIWDNGKGTNYALFIVADKSLTAPEAKTLIEFYKYKYRGYKLINIYIFCDETYADYQYMDAMDYHDPGDEIFKHVMYWYQTGEWSSSGIIFVSSPTVDYPTTGNACK